LDLFNSDVEFQYGVPTESGQALVIVDDSATEINAAGIHMFRVSSFLLTGK
jgi:hypothetical protein